MKKWNYNLLLIVIVSLTCSRNSEHLEKAKAFLDIRRYDNAIEQAELAIQENPRLVEAHISKGRAFLLKEQFDDAKDAFDTAILLDTNIRDNIAQIYFDTGKEVLDKRTRTAKFCFKLAIENQPEIGKLISDMFIEKAFQGIETSPNITKDQIGLLELAIEFCDPRYSESQKEKIADMLFREAIKRKEKSFYKSSVSLAFDALDFNPLLQNELISHILNLCYERILFNLDTYYWHDKLYQVYLIDNSLEKDPKYLYYYLFSSIKKPEQLDAQKAEKYLIDHSESEFAEDVLLQLIQYYYYRLEFDKADFYLAQYKTSYKDGKYMSDILSIEQKLKELH